MAGRGLTGPGEERKSQWAEVIYKGGEIGAESLQIYHLRLCTSHGDHVGHLGGRLVGLARV